MSLINQVLKDLDKRGARTDIGEATIRVVHTRSGMNAALLVALGAAGTLALGTAAWWLWLRPMVPPALPLKTLPPLAAQSQPQSAVLAAASQPLVPLPPPVPQMAIDRVTPDRLLANGKAQLITIYGQHFPAGVSVSLHNPHGEIFANRPIRDQSESTLVLKVNFGRKPGDWQVEVRDAEGKHSVEHALSVQAPEEVPRQPSTQERRRGQSVPAATNQTVVPPIGINKQPTQISPQQQAENEYRRADQMMRQGRISEAMAGFELALQLYPPHEAARQSLVGLLLEQKRGGDAERLLQAGLQINPQHSGFAMLLARLQVEHGNIAQALDTLQKTLPYAEKQPDYLAFVAALLQRQNRHAEAVAQYQKALQLKPQSGVWQMGLGISLRAEQRNAEAREAFQRALDSNSLNAELQAYVRQQLKEL
jgi:MSHA biogenesis protein MshN